MKGHLVKRGSTWTAVLDVPRVNGKRQQKWKKLPGVSTKSEAQAALRRLLTQYEQTNFLEPTSMTVGEVLDKYLRSVEDHIRRVTYERYETSVRAYLKPRLGDIALAKLMPLDIENHIVHLREAGAHGGKPLARPTVQVALRILRAAIAWAVRMRLIAFNVCQVIKSPPVGRTEARFCEVSEIERLTTYARQHDPELYTPILVAVGLGLRRAELFGLRWQDVDLDNGMLTVRHTLVRLHKSQVFSEPKTVRSRRDVVMPAFVIAALRTHKADQNERRLKVGPDYNSRGLVFTGVGGDPWSIDFFGRRFARIAKRVGLKGIGLHTLRHSCASLLLSRGLPLPAVSAVLGHSNTAITASTYAHALHQARAEAAEHMNAALAGSITGSGGKA
ncbi:MAG TPA: tyrosine-type recombinase/integrase [Candidatus Eremiobacteraceae bacterium]|nr:tyrosine-type recombinase/integrase [Candidatus Eremiobacteraceae bacterium]